jgi:hypothetical protein
MPAPTDARENREIVTIDIPGTFLYAINADYVVMRINGTLMELMAKTDPKLCRKYLTDKKEKKVMYLRLQKALYRMM